MGFQFYRGAAVAEREAEQSLQNRHVDIQRLWKRLPPQPQGYAGGRPSPQYGPLGSMILTNIFNYPATGGPLVGDWLMASGPAQAVLPTGGSGDTQYPAGIDFGSGEPTPSNTFSEGKSQFEFRRFRLIILYLYNASNPLVDWKWMPYVFSGAWSGRIVLMITGNSNLTNFANSRTYYNAHWAATTGITCSNLGVGGGHCTGTCGDASGIPVGGANLTAGMSTNTQVICPFRLSGGNDVITCNSFPIVQESTVTFGGTGRVNFVVMGDDGLAACTGTTTGEKPFVQNLWTLEV